MIKEGDTLKVTIEVHNAGVGIDLNRRALTHALSLTRATRYALRSFSRWARRPT